MSVNNFLRPPEFYQRSINPIGQYAFQMSYYLQVMTNQPEEVCKKYVIDGIKNKTFQGMVDPEVEFFERNEDGDRFPTTMPLSKYINSVVRDNLILAPTHTCYVHPSVERSLLAEFTTINKEVRAIAKKEANNAKARGNMDLFIAKNNEQDNRKRYNNSLSGAFVAGGSVVNNPTAHSTLTSITRTVGSLGNASNEKIISGNRHYFNAKITLANLIAITSMMDKNEMKMVLDTYQLAWPTLEQTVECVKYSSNLYWNDPYAFKDVEAYLSKISPIERAGVVYIGDFYHIRKLNDSFARSFLKELSTKVRDVVVPDVDVYLKKMDELVMNYTHQICMEEMRGKGTDHYKLTEENKHIVAATAVNIEKTIDKYKLFVDAIFLTKIIPATTAHIKELIRRSVVLSDTDSTMFSCDEWVKWYFDDLIFSDEAFAVSGAVMYIATQSIAHTLAIFSANMNVERKELFTLAMKPEFVFPVFAQTTVAKHYYTIIYAKEGKIYAEPEMEIKGVHLKSSAVPKKLVLDAASIMKEILLTIIQTGKISVNKYIRKTLDVEADIMESLRQGKTTYLRTSKIKSPEAYTQPPELSNYQHHQMWMDVFVPKYQSYETPIYGVVKIPSTLSTKNKMAKWLEKMEDRELANRMGTWFAKQNKKAYNTFYISKSYVDSYGIPKEILEVMDMKSIVLDVTNMYRIILGTLGYFPKSGWTLTEELIESMDKVAVSTKPILTQERIYEH